MGLAAAVWICGMFNYEVIKSFLDIGRKMQNYLGLTKEEAKKKLIEHGVNELVPPKKSNLWHKILEVVSEPMFLLLIVASVIYFILGEPRDGAIMLFFIFFIVVIDVVQEWKTDKTLEALREMSTPHVTVIRDGEEQIIDSNKIVPGDLMLIVEGEKIAADGEILTNGDLTVDESSLTGESVPTEKRQGEKVFAGTVIIGGGARIRVTQTGAKTEYGKIGTQVAEAPNNRTLLQKQVDLLIKYSTIIGGILFVIVAGITWWNLAEVAYKARLIDSILAGITLAMSIIPEEFPVILTVFLSMGAWRMAKKQALIRKLPSIETLGAISVLCTDKTGTLTENKMKVVEVYGKDIAQLLECMVLACEEDTFDPMEKAIINYAVKEDKNLVTKKKQQSLFKDYAFTNASKRMGHVWKNNENYFLAVKGAPESVVELCKLTQSERKNIEAKQLQMAQQAYRVLAVACQKRSNTNFPDKLSENQDLEFVGLVALMDPPRKAVPKAIVQAQKAGVRVIMITGDNGATAAAIAKQIGLLGEGEIKNWEEHVLTGQQLGQMKEAELMSKLKTINIFARVVPEDKMKIVKALKKMGEIVAMTGDGVNDAPALKYANIGIAMGKRGTQVAQEAADMVITDDNFATILTAIKDGRRIYDNIKKSVVYIFVIHIPIALTALLAPLLGITPVAVMMLPLQVVLLELVIDPTCSIIFERQPAEPDVMKRGPRDPKQFLLNKTQLRQIVCQGLTIFVASFGIYYYELMKGESAELARTMGVAVLVLASLFLVYVNSSETRSAWNTFKMKLADKVIWLVNGGIVAMLLTVIYSPFNKVMKLEALTWQRMFACLILAVAATCWWEIVKWQRKKII